MGCSNGTCGIGSARNAGATAIEHDMTGGYCCAECAGDAYKNRMRTMLNPWAKNAGRRNAGANPIPGADLTPLTETKYFDASGNPVLAPVPGGTSQANVDAGAYGLAGQALSQLGQTIRQQQVNDAQLAAINANNAALAARQAAARAAGPLSANMADTSATGGSSNTMLLVLLAAGAAVLSGAVKIPGMRSRR